MGIKGLSTIIKSLYSELSTEEACRLAKTVSISSLKGATIVIDYSMMAFQHGNSIFRGDLEAMNTGCIIGFLQFINLSRVSGFKPIIILDQVNDDDEPLSIIGGALRDMSAISSSTSSSKEALSRAAAANGLDAAIILQAKTETREKRIQTRRAIEADTKKDQFRVSDGLADVIQSICRYFGVECYRPLVEADWLLAHVAREESKKGDTYIMTEDSDLLIYDVGEAKMLRRNTVSGEGRLKGIMYQVIDPIVLWRSLGLPDERSRILLAVILGCDYFDGIYMIGPSTVLHALSIPPPHCGSKRIGRDYLATLIALVRPSIDEHGKINMAAYFPRLPASRRATIEKKFNACMTTATVFDGFTIEEIGTQMTIPIDRVVHYLAHAYRYPLLGADIEIFHHSLDVMTVSCDLEASHHVQRLFIEGDDSPEAKEKLGRSIVSLVHDNTIKLVGVFATMGVDMGEMFVQQSIEIERELMEELGLLDRKEVSSTTTTTTTSSSSTPSTSSEDSTTPSAPSTSSSEDSTTPSTITSTPSAITSPSEDSTTPSTITPTPTK